MTYDPVACVLELVEGLKNITFMDLIMIIYSFPDRHVYTFSELVKSVLLD